MIVTSAFYPNIELRECALSEMVPVFKIDEGYKETFIYRYGGNLWAVFVGMTTEKVIQNIQNGLYSIPELRNVASKYLFSGNTVYVPAVEPFYWLDPSYSTPNGMIKVAIQDDGFLEYRRRYSHRERETAVSCAHAIHKLIYNEKANATEKWKPNIILALPAFYEVEVPRN